MFKITEEEWLEANIKYLEGVITRSEIILKNMKTRLRNVRTDKQEMDKDQGEKSNHKIKEAIEYLEEYSELDDNELRENIKSALAELRSIK